MNPPCFRRGKVQGASMREYELEVLEQYDIEVISTRKTRGAYFCNTKEGLMLLGPAGISVGRAPLMYVLLCYLESIITDVTNASRTMLFNIRTL